jgi:cell division protein FtsI/penicillin-binding protein 2
VVATAALDAGAIKDIRCTPVEQDILFQMSSFQEYHNHSYGTLNVVGALTVSSNIYFCELIRNWDMNALVPYLEKFGIGSLTG